jgi:hypothetical protein
LNEKKANKCLMQFIKGQLTILKEANWKSKQKSRKFKQKFLFFFCFFSLDFHFFNLDFRDILHKLLYQESGKLHFDFTRLRRHIAIEALAEREQEKRKPDDEDYGTKECTTETVF